MTDRPSGEGDLDRSAEPSVELSLGPSGARRSSGEADRNLRLGPTGVPRSSGNVDLTLRLGSPSSGIDQEELAAFREQQRKVSRARAEYLAARISSFNFGNATTSSTTEIAGQPSSGAVNAIAGQPSPVPEKLLTGPLSWLPSRSVGSFRKKVVAPSLHSMCIDTLCDNIAAVESLVGVPEASLNLLSRRLCATRKMEPSTFRLITLSKPSELIVPDSSLLPEQAFIEAFANRSRLEKLQVLELGLCGRSLSDRVCAQIALPNLHSLILSGAYRMSDKGLAAMLRKAPNLRSLKLIECSAISSAGIEALSKSSFGPALKALSLQSCSQFNASEIQLPLQKLASLESLSLSEISAGMSDKIMTELVVRLGSGLRELFIANCGLLTDAAIQTISLSCTNLKLLDLSWLPQLTDEAIGSLATGRCRSLTTLRLTRGKFSDAALAAMIAASGKHLTELSLNNVRQTGDLTLGALALYSAETLEKLDLSFCRAVRDEALGFLTDSCQALQELKLFGCVQLTRYFWDGHSNPVVDLIGLPNYQS